MLTMLDDGKIGDEVAKAGLAYQSRRYHEAGPLYRTAALHYKLTGTVWKRPIDC